MVFIGFSALVLMKASINEYKYAKNCINLINLGTLKDIFNNN
jgi:hypothetical protein